MKRQKIVTLILLLMLLSSIMQLKDSLSKYVDKAVCMIENPATAITDISLALIHKSNGTAVQAFHFLVFKSTR